MAYEHKQAPFNGPGGYGVAGYPFRGGIDALPTAYYKETARLCAGIFNKGATPDASTRRTDDGLVLNARDGYVSIAYGTSIVPIRPDEMEEVINDIRVLMAIVNAEESQDTTGYNPGAGMTVPAGVGPSANDASTAGPDMQAGGGNNAQPSGPNNAGGNTGVSAFGQWLSGLRPPITRDGM